jgi:hypothetical protein
VRGGVRGGFCDWRGEVLVFYFASKGCVLSVCILEIKSRETVPSLCNT